MPVNIGMTRTTEKLIDRAKFERVKEIAGNAFDRELLTLNVLLNEPAPLKMDVRSAQDWLKQCQFLSSAKHKQLAFCVALCKTMAVSDAKPIDKTEQYRVLMDAVKSAFDQKQLDEIDADLKSMQGDDV